MQTVQKPKHGEKRNVKTVSDFKTIEMIDTKTGNKVDFPFGGMSYPSFEIYCSKCDEWVQSEKGISALMSSVWCHKCEILF